MDIDELRAKLGEFDGDIEVEVYDPVGEMYGPVTQLRFEPSDHSHGKNVVKISAT